MDLVLLLDLEPEVFDEYLDESSGDVIKAGVKGCHKAGIKWNEIHPERQIHMHTYYTGRR